MNFNHHQLNRPARTWAGWWLALILLLLAAAPTARAQSEEGIKAAFIFNFAKFTTWPEHAFTNNSAPIIVGFVGADALAETFERSVTGKSINGHEVVVRRFPDAASLEPCQMIFIGDTAEAAAVIKATAGQPVLTIGDSDRFAAAGGMINLIKDRTKIRFDIDLVAARTAKIKLDSRLCNLARSTKSL